MDQPIDSQPEDIDYLMEPPGDLHEIYMRQRLNLSKAKNMFSYYMILLSLLNVGTQLVPDAYDRLKEKVLTTLESLTTYPQKRQVEQDGDSYLIGGSDTGRIFVRHEDIGYGLDQAKEQQVSIIVPTLARYDNQILTVLVREKIIEKRRPILEDLLIEKTVAELSKLLERRQDYAGTTPEE